MLASEAHTSPQPDLVSIPDTLSYPWRPLALINNLYCEQCLFLIFHLH